MKFKAKKALFALLSLAALVFTAGCGVEMTPYETNNNENYTVSVKYDANGGFFTTNTSVIVDSYNISEMKANSDGLVEIALLSPDAAQRGNDSFNAVKNGYFLAGWYTQRNGNGESDYTYSGKWDFSKDLVKVDSSKEYSSETPVLTLYAAWVPLFTMEFYSLGTNELLKTFTIDPNSSEGMKIPAWDEKTGVMEMYKFPKKSGYTFNKVYYDAEGKNPVEGDTIMHTGVVDYATGTAKDATMKLYVEWVEGEWYHITTAEQLANNAALNGNYEILADLDFDGIDWGKTFMYGNFSGTIKGNGHVIKNVALEQTDAKEDNAGLFGYLTDKANISDLTFENVTFTIKAGTIASSANYGVLAGTVSEVANITDVSILSSKLQIDSGCYFGTDDYSIGLVCGMGDPSVADPADIQCVAVGDAPETVEITVNGNEVIVEMVSNADADE